MKKVEKLDFFTNRISHGVNQAGMGYSFDAKALFHIEPMFKKRFINKPSSVRANKKSYARSTSLNKKYFDSKMRP